MKNFVIRILVSAIAVWACAGFFQWIAPSSGIHLTDYGTAIWAALAIGFMNAIVKPILTILTLPITVLTLGLFLLVINALMFYWAGSLIDGFGTGGLTMSFLFSLVYSTVLTFLDSVFGVQRD
ncbi:MULTISPECIES: phage holin family protein [unclassified Flammeovirga]|uniref:phage holin family protein n=1 Tax=unclassified Flammeovirga TaxID=2637820 RepID=UPI0005C69D50|nr:MULTISPECIES: phage holin family protein [unclassified Flammeovirga]MBD0402284.1 phage holin family protein [Flammeovirga sp. EKP202]